MKLSRLLRLVVFLMLMLFAVEVKAAATLTWVDNATNELGFLVLRQVNQYNSAGVKVTAGSFSPLTQIAVPNTQGFIDNGAVADPALDNEYCYIVKAYNLDNNGVQQESPNSNTACKRFSVIIPPPGAPTGLTVQ